MIINTPDNCDSSLLTKRFALGYFKKSIAPLGNCVTFVGPWKGHRAGTSSESALHFLWEIPRQLTYSGIEINWMLLPSLATAITQLTGRPTELIDNTIRTYTTQTGQDFGIVTCDVSSRVLIGATVGHIAFHIHPGTDCFPMSVGLFDLLTIEQRNKQGPLSELAKTGIQTFYALTSRLFFTESMLNDDI